MITPRFNYMVLGTNDFGVYSVNVLIKMAANVLGQLMLNIQIHLQLNPLTTDDTYVSSYFGCMFSICYENSFWLPRRVG